MNADRLGAVVDAQVAPPAGADDPAGAAAPRGSDRVAGLDGLRGLAALTVVVCHCWLYTFMQGSRITGPPGLSWLVYGRAAVVFFLILSGFSLAVPAARHGWRLGGLLRFARRRAWRILPPYWAALVFSVGVSWAVVRASHFGPPGPRSVLVHALLLQDVSWAPTPNGAFWSIAVEAELYLLFPLLLLLRRRLGPVVLLAAATVPVIALGLLAEGHNPDQGRIGLAPHLAPLFVLGVVVAGVLVAPERIRRLPWPWLAGLAAAPVLVLLGAKGPAWTVQHSFWVDLALGPAMGLLVAAVATGRPAALVRLLDTAPLRRLGGFSYSLYLVHLPVVMTINRRLVGRLTESGLTEFAFTLLLGVPASVAFAWAFSKVFELPFQRHRSWASVSEAARNRLTSLRPLGVSASAAGRWRASVRAVRRTDEPFRGAGRRRLGGAEPGP